MRSNGNYNTQLNRQPADAFESHRLRPYRHRSHARAIDGHERRRHCRERASACLAGRCDYPREGWHAVDAAIAVNAVMGVVAPMMNGVGGDLFAIVYDAASGELHGLNASGCAPAALTIDRLRAEASRACRRPASTR